MDAINFVHISDTHLNSSPEKGFVKYDVAAKFLAVVEAMAASGLKPDFFLVTGDLAHEGDDEDYRFMKGLFAEAEGILGAQAVCCVGNHDDRERFFRSYLGAEPRAKHYDARTIKGLRVVTLDSKVGAHTVAGRLGAEQLAWLAELLKSPAERGTIVCLHHPPASPVLPDMDSHCLADREELAQAIAGSDVMGIFSGHTHATAFWQFMPGVMSVTAGSTAFNMHMGPESVHILDTLSWNACKIDGRGRLACTAMHRSADRIAAEIPYAALKANMAEYDPESYPVVERA